MKPSRKVLLCSLAIVAVQLAVSGCVGPVEGGGVVYGGGGLWFHDDVWVDGGGRGWYGGHGGGAYVHPSGRGDHGDHRH